MPLQWILFAMVRPLIRMESLNEGIKIKKTKGNRSKSFPDLWCLNSQFVSKWNACIVRGTKFSFQAIYRYIVSNIQREPHFRFLKCVFLSLSFTLSLASSTNVPTFHCRLQLTAFIFPIPMAQVLYYPPSWFNLIQFSKFLSATPPSCRRILEHKRRCVLGFLLHSNYGCMDTQSWTYSNKSPLFNLTNLLPSSTFTNIGIYKYITFNLSSNGF